jgi:hypothetical protein
MNEPLMDLLSGAGLDHLIDGGYSKSGFVKKLLSQVKAQHKGQYKPSKAFKLSAIEHPSQWLTQRFGEKGPTLAQLKRMLPFVRMDHNPVATDAGRELKKSKTKSAFYGLLDEMNTNQDFTNEIKPFFSTRFQEFNEWLSAHPDATELTQGNPLLIKSSGLSSGRRRGRGRMDDAYASYLSRLPQPTNNLDMRLKKGRNDVSYLSRVPPPTNNLDMRLKTGRGKFFDKGFSFAQSVPSTANYLV